MFEAAGLAVADLAEFGVAQSAEEDDLERYSTFEENALAKARHFFRVVGVPVVADDSGLEVDALGGRPGVHSKRWSGRVDLTGASLDAANNSLLQQSLRGVDKRSARYVCVAAYVDDDFELTRRGEVEGYIADAPRGAEGFGYDPYFVAAGLGRTFGELAIAEKERLSHRGRAFGALIRAIAGVG
jgi:XTP/dITP diphosphohydrolase